MMQVSVTFFSFIQQWAGTDRLQVDLTEESTVISLLEILSEKFQIPAIKDQPLSIMVNQKVVQPQSVLNEGDQVLLLPIMEGG
ncbi:MAG: MoaD/ThiS family protein [Thermodesulfobacteriota bacterium]